MSSRANVPTIRRVPRSSRQEYDLGMKALVDALGNTGATRFLMQFETGSGDYTKDRESILEGITLDEVIANVRKTGAERGTPR